MRLYILLGIAIDEKILQLPYRQMQTSNGTQKTIDIQAILK